jgi:uncharacterized membrane protein
VKNRRLEEQLARLLSGGTWIACAIIGAGLAAMLGLPAAGARLGAGLVTAGVVIFVLLPALRVAWMLIAFARARAYRFAAVAGLVLVAIAAGFAVGVS